MQKIRSLIQGRFAGLARAYQRFPVTIGLAIGLFLFLILNEYRMDQVMGQVWFGRILTTWILSILLAFLIGVHTERKNLAIWKIALLYTLGLAIVAGVYFVVFSSDERLFVKDGVYVYFGLILATLLGIFLESSLKPGERVPHKAVEVLNSFAWTGLFSFVIGLGTFLVFAMIEYLFKPGFRLDRFGRVIFESTMLLFAVPFFLSGLKPSGETFEGEYEPLFRKLLRFVCLPLAFVYTTVLYAYSAKILVTRTWPQGLVSHLVLWYSLFVIAVYIFLRADKPKLPKLLDLFPLAVVPLMGMMFGSIGLRISQYGITPNRYLVVLAGIWALIALIYLGFRRIYRPWLLLASLVLFILIGTNSPIGAYDLSVRSQRVILESVLTQSNMLEGETLLKGSPDKVARERISETVLWFVNHQSADQLSFLPADYSVADFETVFGFKPTYADRSNDFPSYAGFYSSGDFELPTSEGRLLFIALQGQPQKQVEDITLRLEGAKLVLEYEGQTHELDLDFIQEYQSKQQPATGPIRLLDGRLSVYLQSASGSVTDGELTLQDASVYLLISSKK